jgi:hypothetical protein
MADRLEYDAWDVAGDRDLLVRRTHKIRDQDVPGRLAFAGTANHAALS